MSRIPYRWWRTRYAGHVLAIVFVGLALGLVAVDVAPAAGPPARFSVTGRLTDQQGQPVASAEVSAQVSSEAEPVAVAESQEDGSWDLLLEAVPKQDVIITIDHHHFQRQTVSLSTEQLDALNETGTYSLGELTLERRITAGFWAATIIFLLMLLVIASEKLHSTTAALAGMSAVFVVTFVGGAFHPGFYIFSFERALTYINWEVIFLVMGMMIVIAIIEGTGVFQWTAFQAYRLSRGHAWLLALMLMLITAVASALLDNFTTMLLMAPISLQIGLALGINPLAFIIPEVLASNVAGISTLIGTPTNILIGAYADIGFNGFLVNQTVGVVLALAVMAGFILYYYRHEWRKSQGGVSPALYERMKENARIRKPETLWKAGLVFALILTAFVVGERYQIVPAVTALVGATALLVWVESDVDQMIRAVDWTTLVFFMALFIVVGAVQEVGLISLIAGAMGWLIGKHLVLGIFVIVFGAGTLSTAIANIPLTAAMLPVVQFLTGSIPGAGNNVLYYALSMGAAMGGNGLLIGGEANLVTAGITKRAGSPISFREFLRVGLPTTYLTLAIGFLWLVVHFVIFGS